MITIYDSADMQRVLSGPIDPDLKTILLGRLELLAEFLGEFDLSFLANFIVVEPGDSIEAIERELTISPVINRVDGARFPEKSFVPNSEFCIARKGYFDMTFALSDAGPNLCLLVPDRDDIEPMLLELCRTYATP